MESYQQTTKEYPLGNKPITFRYLVCSLRHLSSLGLFLIKTRAVVTETAFTITSTVFTLETRSLFTRKGRISSLVSVGNNISREVKELSKILKTRVSKSVVEVAPRNHRLNHKNLPAVSLLNITTRPERLEKLNNLKIAYGNVFTVFILTKNIGSMNIINGGENTIYKNGKNNLFTNTTTYLQKVGDRPKECPFYQQAFFFLIKSRDNYL